MAYEIDVIFSCTHKSWYLYFGPYICQLTLATPRGIWLTLNLNGGGGKTTLHKIIIFTIVFKLKFNKKSYCESKMEGRFDPLGVARVNLTQNGGELHT